MHRDASQLDRKHLKGEHTRRMTHNDTIRGRGEAIDMTKVAMEWARRCAVLDANESGPVVLMVVNGHWNVPEKARPHGWKEMGIPE